MRWVIAFLMTVIFLTACNVSQKTVEKQDEFAGTVKNDTIRIENEELEYEIIIIENGFNSWLATQPTENFFSQSTLEVKNNFYVIEWNQRVQNPQRFNPNLYQWPINYDASIDYGMEVNYLLYMYFEFFQQKYNQRLR
jgi:hypothetical protein